ncbi:hypothetical protein Srufu_035210 [Streptomyces libani subsp. rufus]|nr:hypothetical protein Srufu_035210 [Streptomyces libani subsp. rufus]
MSLCAGGAPRAAHLPASAMITGIDMASALLTPWTTMPGHTERAPQQHGVDDAGADRLGRTAQAGLGGDAGVMELLKSGRQASKEALLRWFAERTVS